MRDLETSKAISVRTRSMVYCGLMTALGILLPQAFHAFGQDAGMVFLPIQIPVLFAGLIAGPVYGGITGVLVAGLSSMLTGMPPVPKVYFMVFELAAYGITAGIMKKRFHVLISLIAAMAAGRLVYGAVLAAAVNLIGFQAPFANGAAFVSGIISGIPGMAIQIIVLPALYHILKKGGLLQNES